MELTKLSRRETYIRVSKFEEDTSDEEEEETIPKIIMDKPTNITDEQISKFICDSLSLDFYTSPYSLFKNQAW